MLTEFTMDLPEDIQDRLRAASPEARDRAIVDAHNAGATLRQIAALVGLSPPGVRKIIQRTEGS